MAQNQGSISLYIFTGISPFISSLLSFSILSERENLGQKTWFGEYKKLIFTGKFIFERHH